MELGGQLHGEERAPGTHWIGRWVGPKTDWDAVKKRKSGLAENRIPAIQNIA
jgi:hypothetical protein